MGLDLGVVMEIRPQCQVQGVELCVRVPAGVSLRMDRDPAVVGQPPLQMLMRSGQDAQRAAPSPAVGLEIEQGLEALERRLGLEDVRSLEAIGIVDRTERGSDRQAGVHPHAEAEGGAEYQDLRQVLLEAVARSS